MNDPKGPDSIQKEATKIERAKPFSILVAPTGFEPVFSAWEADVLTRLDDGAKSRMKSKDILKPPNRQQIS